MWNRLLCGCAVLVAVHGGASRAEVVEAGHPGVIDVNRAGSASDRSTGGTTSDRGTGPTPAILRDEIPPDQWVPLPPNARIIRHYGGGLQTEGASDRSGDLTSPKDEKLIYSNTRGSLIYRPPLAGARIADDIVTQAVEACELSRHLIRVNGGVENGHSETFETTVALTEHCPSTDYYGPTIPGTELTFRDLVADINTIHELVVDFTNPNIGICTNGAGCRINAQDCYDGSECATRTEPVIIPPRVWLRVEFSRREAGWIVGTPPTVGFSTDYYDNFFTGCYTWFGGYPNHLHASFYAQFWASAEDGACPTHFPAYLASDPHADAYDAPPIGTLDQLFADDIELIVDRCELSVIEVETKGIRGPYQIDFDLRTFPSDPPTPGTEFHWVSSYHAGNGNLEVARLEFPPGITIEKNFWITWMANKHDSGVILARHAELGSGGPLTAWFDPDPPPGEWVVGTQQREAHLAARVYCRGEPYTGACCRDQPDEPLPVPVCEDNVSVFECMEDRWVQGGTCPGSNDDPDDPWALRGEPPCGAQACCLPGASCLNLTWEECLAFEDPLDPGVLGEWLPSGLCEENSSVCRTYGACCLDEPNIPGYDPWCWDKSTADTCAEYGGRWINRAYGAVCPTGYDDPNDPWLLQGEAPCGTQACCLPDSSCANFTHDECLEFEDPLNPGISGQWFLGEFCPPEGGSYLCPPGKVVWSDPPDRVIDARQPSDIAYESPPQGIELVVVEAPPGAADTCFTLCETQAAGADNFIRHVTECPPGLYLLRLDRPITPGAVTEITYGDDAGGHSTAAFISLPADGNADGLSHAEDIFAVVTCCMDGTCTPAYGEYSCDIDRSGLVTAEDVLRVVDLLNGADGFQTWENQTYYDLGECE